MNAQVTAHDPDSGTYTLKHVSYKDRKTVAADLKPIYQAATEDEAADALEAFEDSWAQRYPMIGEAWRDHWERFIPFFAFPPEIRKIIYQFHRGRQPPAPQDHQDPRPFPDRRRRAETAVAGVDTRREEVDHLSHPGLAASTAPVRHLLPRPGAGRLTAVR